MNTNQRHSLSFIPFFKVFVALAGLLWCASTFDHVSAQQPPACPLPIGPTVDLNVSFNNGFFCSTDGGSYIKVAGMPYPAWCADAAAQIIVAHDECFVSYCNDPQYTKLFPADPGHTYSATVIDSLRLSCPTHEGPPGVSSYLYAPDPDMIPSPDSCVWNEINWLINHKQGNADTVQAAIWDLISTPDCFALSTVPNRNELLRAAMVAEAKLHSDFLPGAGNVRAAVLYVSDDIQFVFVEIPCPCNVTVTCSKDKTNECTASWDFDAPTASGPVTLSIVSTDTNKSGFCGNTYEATRTWEVTDACGNKTRCSQTVKVIDTTLPTITCAQDKTVECTTSWNFDAPTASDTCGNATVSIVGTVTNANCGNTFTATRTWEATDDCGNKARCSQKVTVVDTTPPTIRCAQDKTVECGSTWNFDRPSASDTCGNATISIINTVTNAGNCGFTATRTWEAMDDCGNKARCSQTVTVRDTTPPVITCVPSKTVSCGQGWNFDAPTATDTCGSATVSIISTTTNQNACLFTATRTWKALDACGNMAQCSQTVTVDCSSPCVPSTFSFTTGSGSALDGPDGNIRTFTTNGISVKVSAFSREKTSGAWSTAWLGQYSGGLGVTDSGEGTGANNSHTVDNIDRDNFVLFEFSQPVVLNRANLGYVVSDSDLTLWIGTFSNPYNNHLTLSDSVLSSFGYTEDNLTDLTTTRWADVNAGEVIGNAIVIAAWTADATPEDQFKIALLDLCKRTCQPLKLECVGTSGQVGTPYSSALVASGGTPPYTYSIASGSLPPGLTLNPTMGTITGTPTTAGTFTFTAKVTDSLGATAFSTCTSGCSAGSCTTTWDFTSPGGCLGVSQAYTAGGMTITAYGYNIVSGQPTNLFGKTGGGDENGLGICAENDHEIDKSTAIILDLSDLINKGAQNAQMWIGSAQPGEPYKIYGSTDGSNYVVLLTSGLDFTYFPVPGYPTYKYIAVTADGSSNPLSDVLLGAVSVSCPGACAITIRPPLSPLGLSCVSKTSGQVGTAYSSSLVASGGITPYTYSIFSGSLPNGLVLNPSTGAITGTPSVAGVFSFTAKVVDSTGGTAQTKTVNCSITITQPPRGCTLTIGYYKNHPTAIAPLPIYLGTSGGAKTFVVSSQQIGVDILGQHVYGAPANGITKLYAQLLAAKLNILGGATATAASSAISSADAFLATHNYLDWGFLTATEQNSVLAWHSTLDNYNNGVIGPGHCGDTECARALTCTGTSGSTQVKLCWKASAEATSYKVLRSATPNGPYTAIKTGLTDTNYTDTTVVNGSAYYYVVSALHSGVETTDSDEVSAIPSGGLVSPWNSKDIGNVTSGGGASYGSGTFTVVGSGADIWDVADEFRYVYQLASGDCSIVARVTGIQNTDPWAKAGVMIRETLTTGSKQASVLLTPGNGVAFISRATTGGSSVDSNNPKGLVAPYWVKIVRSGSTFTGYYSLTGSTWTSMGSQTITMGSSVYIGLGVTSHNDGVLCTATFNNVTATP